MEKGLDDVLGEKKIILPNGYEGSGFLKVSNMFKEKNGVPENVRVLRCNNTWQIKLANYVKPLKVDVVIPVLELFGDKDLNRCICEAEFEFLTTGNGVPQWILRTEMNILSILKQVAED